MLKKLMLSLTAIIVLGLIVIAQDKSVTLEGHIVDKNCATGKDAKQSDPQAAAANESKGCILMKSCFESGLGIYSDGKYTVFDDKGNALAKAALEKSKKDKGAKFKVIGKVTDGKLAVGSITEVK